MAAPTSPAAAVGSPASPSKMHGQVQKSRHAYEHAMELSMRARALWEKDTPTASRLYAEAVDTLDKHPDLLVTGLPVTLSADIANGRISTLYAWAFLARQASLLPMAVSTMERALKEEKGRIRGGIVTDGKVAHMLVFQARWLLQSERPRDALACLDEALPALFLCATTMEARVKRLHREYIEALQVQHDAFTALGAHGAALRVIEVSLWILGEAEREPPPTPDPVTRTLLLYNQAKRLESLERWAESLASVFDAFQEARKITYEGPALGSSMQVQLANLKLVLDETLEDYGLPIQPARMTSVDEADRDAALAHIDRAIDILHTVNLYPDTHPRVIDVRRKRDAARAWMPGEKAKMDEAARLAAIEAARLKAIADEEERKRQEEEKKAQANKFAKGGAAWKNFGKK